MFARQPLAGVIVAAAAAGFAPAASAQNFRDDALHLSAGYIITTAATQLDRPAWQGIGASAVAAVVWEVARPNPDARDAMMTVTGALSAWAWNALTGRSRTVTSAVAYCAPAAPRELPPASAGNEDGDRDHAEELGRSDAAGSGAQRPLGERRVPGTLAEAIGQQQTRILP